MTFLSRSPLLFSLTMIYMATLSFHFSLRIFNVASFQIRNFPVLQISIKWKFVFGTGEFRTTNQNKAGVMQKFDVLNH